MSEVVSRCLPHRQLWVSNNDIISGSFKQEINCVSRSYCGKLVLSYLPAASPGYPALLDLAIRFFATTTRYQLIRRYLVGVYLLPFRPAFRKVDNLVQ